MNKKQLLPLYPLTILLLFLLLGGIFPAAAAEGKPGREDLEAINSGIEYPKEDEYLDEYIYAEVFAPHGHSVFGFGSADRQGSRYTVLNGEQVKILAERNGIACVIVLSQNRARWINSLYLFPLGDAEDQHVAAGSGLSEGNMDVQILKGVLVVSGEGKVGASDVAAAVPDNALVTHIVVKDGITEIGVEAFREFASVSSVILPDSLKGIGEAAFLGCSSLRSIHIPSHTTTIDARAFAYCSALETVELPDGITELPYGLFAHCSSLTTLTIPGTVTSIGPQVFWGAANLRRVDIPDSVTEIGDYALLEGTQIRSLYLPEGLRNTGEHTFLGWWHWTPLSDIYYAGSEAQWKALGITTSSDTDLHFNASRAAAQQETAPLFLLTGDTLTISGNGKIQVADVDMAVPDVTEVSTVIIEDGITRIGNHAFSGFRNLRTVAIPESVASIGLGAFSSCERLESITLPKSLTAIEENTFAYCKNLREILIQENVTSIGKRAFEYCESLSILTIPERIVTIGEHIVAGCKNLRSIYIPAGVLEIEKDNFQQYETPVLNDIYYGGTEEQWMSLNLSLHREMNVHCSAEMAEQIIMEYVFSGNTLTISGNGGILKEDLEAHTAEKLAVKAVLICDGVTGIGEHCFSWYENLESIIIPGSVKSIGESAFFNCVKLKNLSLPDGLAVIGAHSFSLCKSIGDIYIPSSVTEIGAYVFSQTTSTKNIYISGSGVNIDKLAFNTCFDAEHIYFAGTEEQWEAMGLEIRKYTTVQCNWSP